jgi:preprotein translocase SecE subunit
MAVAVKNSPETRAPWHFDHLAFDCLVGVAYVLVGLAAVFWAVPALWDLIGWSASSDTATSVTVSLQILVMLLVAGLFVWGGVRLTGPQPRPGLRAGVITGILAVVLVTWITCAIGLALEGYFGPHSQVGAGITVLVGLVLAAGLVKLFLAQGFERTMVRLEEQGWFSPASYKRSQGQRVRRGTILGILILAGCGIYTMLHRGAVDTTSNWWIPIPFTSHTYFDTTTPGVIAEWVTWRSIWILPHTQLTLPLVVAALSLWLAWRVVNYPVFADFLIASEAELNKVSWTPRKRLISDTIVVLVTVILLTVFLYAADLLWAAILTKIHVLQAPSPQSVKDLTPQW